MVLVRHEDVSLPTAPLASPQACPEGREQLLSAALEGGTDESLGHAVDLGNAAGGLLSHSPVSVGLKMP